VQAEQAFSAALSFAKSKGGSPQRAEALRHDLRIDFIRPMPRFANEAEDQRVVEARATSSGANRSTTRSSALPFDPVEEPTGCATCNLLGRQKQCRKRWLHKTCEGVVSPPHNQHIIRDADATLA
jgi:hypothetical protein